jgi:hypothetical protein
LQAQQAFGRASIPRWVDIEQDKAGEAYVLQKNNGKRINDTQNWQRNWA